MNNTFIPYLTLNDYLPTIQSGQLNNQILDAVIQGGTFERQTSEKWAIGIVNSKLGKQFNLDSEITPTLPFDYNKTYSAGDRVVIDFDEWIPGVGDEESGLTPISYDIGDCRVWNLGIEGNPWIGYCCSQPNSDNTFKPENWTAIGNQYDIYFIDYPFSKFSISVGSQIVTNVKGLYNLDDKVFDSKKIWKCIRATIVGDHQSAEQYLRTYQLPSPNQFPTQNKQQQWEFVSDFIFKNELPFHPGRPDTDGALESVWTLGDNRDILIVRCITDLTLYDLHSRISPNNIPELRKKRCNNAYEFLNAVRTGTEFVSIDQIQPEQVGDISWGSDIKKVNRVWG